MTSRQVGHVTSWSAHPRHDWCPQLKAVSFLLSRHTPHVVVASNSATLRSSTVDRLVSPPVFRPPPPLAPPPPPP
eukprot:CAMPEP_0197603324 /NCGR_PEP_ID=MMETSP1326-20131121/38993_1 /TAXON_ID=1155430 /ORGANISM="Genus nov. species nov., Strain RCC2288" /LENGTH=74 /DNA_ID=CAMNT_0043170815 /DNA_START=97 /DNA_END=318 /DNA_ORIENTATION=-